MMNKFVPKIVALSFAIIAFVLITNAQNVNTKLLLRDSLDFKSNKVGVNSDKNEFNPLPYKGGLLFVSNKKSPKNPLGFNKVYWVAPIQIGNANIATDSLQKKFVFNDDYTAPTSNDNNILTHYTKAKAKKFMNEVEKQFADFNPDQSFAIDDSTSTIVYPKLSRRKINGVQRWELWEATLKNGKTFKAHKINILDSAADYLYPNLVHNATQLFFASNRVGGKGGFDIYTIYKVNGIWQNLPKNVDWINSEANEIYPIAKPDTILYTSDRVGGLGGYDIYRYTAANQISQNLGYPINSSNDEFALNTIGDQNYLSSNRTGSVDILAMQYEPVTITLIGQMVYAKDAQTLPRQKLYIFDKDEKILVDSLITDEKGNYSFIAKPNRNYEASTVNADGINELIAFKTNDQVIPKEAFVLQLTGRSPKQIKDSVYQALVVAEQKIIDSINALGFTSKYIVYYGFDKSVLDKNEKKTLDVLAAKIKNDASIYLIVGAFTDCVGSFKYNYTLSVKRAKYAVQYLISKGVPKSRFTSNGYSKNYTVTPCLVSTKKAALLVNRRAEIVLSKVKATNWANLEKERGKQYYANVYSTRNKNIPTIDKNNQIVKSIIPTIIKKDTVAKIITKPTIKKETEIAKVTSIVGKKVTIAKLELKPIIKKDSVIAKVAVTTKKDSIAKLIVKPVIKKDSIIAKVVVNPNKDTNLVVATIVNEKEQSGPAINKKDTQVKKPIPILVAKAADYKDDYAKEEILKALDSLATLKREQERIIEYMTKRINKKPIDVFVSSDSVTIEIYDNAIHDKDSVSIIYNNRIIVDKQELKVRKPIVFKLKVDKNKQYNELVMVAENLGSEPPNTAVMFVTEKSGRRQQVMLSTDMTHNEVVYFIRIGKE